MSLVTVTLGQLVDRALEGLQGPPEVGRTVVLAGAAAVGDSSIQLLDSTHVSVTDIVELGAELFFVTAKSSEAPGANLTVIRGHYNTTAVDHAANTIGTLNPGWLARQRVANVICESFPFLEGEGLPLILTGEMVVPYVDPFDSWTLLLPVPEGARQVLTVRLGVHEIPNWTPVHDLAVGDYPDGSVVRLPRLLRQVDGPFSIVYRAPYRWSDDPPVETSTLDIPEGSAHLPPMYAMWKLTESREISRSQIDRSEEWSGMRDTGPQIVRLLREGFYGALASARKLDPPPTLRPYVKRPKFTGYSDLMRR